MRREIEGGGLELGGSDGPGAAESLMGASVPPCYLIIAVRCDSLVDPGGPGRNGIVKGIARSRKRCEDTARVDRPRAKAPPDYQ